MERPTTRGTCLTEIPDLHTGSKNDQNFQRKVWKKVLYEPNTGYPDNYTPPTFLEDLRKNVNLRQYTFTEVWIASGRLTQEISNIIFFIVAFIYLNLNDRSTSAFICATIASVTAVLYPILIWILPVKNSFEEIRSAVIFLATGYFVSPVLCTLTETISTDTIYAMSTLMMLAHLIFYDYGPQAAIVSQPLSLNAAIFAAVCLASRLNNIYVAFALLTLAVDLFVIGSYLRRWIHDRQWENKKSHPNPGGDCGPSSYKSKPSASKHPEMITSLVMGSSSLVALFKAPVLRVYPILLVLLYIFVNLICPYLFYSWQQYKDNIYGPWDEATIQSKSLRRKSQ